MINIFVSVITFNNDSDTLLCLKSLEKLQKRNIDLSVVVVDNASDNPFTVPQNKFSNFTLHVIRNNENLGFAAGHNKSVKYALENKAEYILILNNDTRVDEKLLESLLDGAKTIKNAGIIVPKIYFEKGYEFYKEKYHEEDLGNVIWYAGGIMDWENVVGKNKGVDEVDEGQYDETSETEIATGCCMLIDKNVFTKSGYFDERYFLYYEDTDFTMRVKDNGFKVVYVPNASLWHKNAGSSGGSGSKLQDYFISRNRLIFGMRYAPIRAKLALLKEGIRILITGRKWQKAGVRDYYLHRFGKGRYNV